MLQELSHMDRITQLQDEIQNVCFMFECVLCPSWSLQILMIMSNSIAYLTSRANFLQVSPEIPITKQRNPENYDPPDVFEGIRSSHSKKPTSPMNFLANQKEMVTDLIVKAKQIELLINSLPEPEPEEEQVSLTFLSLDLNWSTIIIVRPNGWKI